MKNIDGDRSTNTFLKEDIRGPNPAELTHITLNMLLDKTELILFCFFLYNILGLAVTSFIFDSCMEVWDFLGLCEKPGYCA